MRKRAVQRRWPGKAGAKTAAKGNSSPLRQTEYQPWLLHQIHKLDRLGVKKG
jgi:hypothetical protein